MLVANLNRPDLEVGSDFWIVSHSFEDDTDYFSRYRILGPDSYELIQSGELVSTGDPLYFTDEDLIWDLENSQHGIQVGEYEDLARE